MFFFKKKEKKKEETAAPVVNKEELLANFVITKAVEGVSVTDEEVQKEYANTNTNQLNMLIQKCLMCLLLN